MARANLGNAPRTLIEEMARLKSHDVILPTANGRRIRLRCVTTPDEPLRILLSRLGLKIPARLGPPTWEPLREPVVKT